MMNWEIFDREYRVDDGIVNTLPESLSFKVEAMQQAKTFFDVHSQVMEHHPGNLLHNKESMASAQMHFYDSMALGFQGMDDTDLRNGGLFWWKIHRLVKYDERFFKPGKLLFCGAGNCRIAMIFTKMGYDVVATDISRNMLSVGKERAEQQGITMTYVAQNAELPFPFKSEQFDVSYSLCVANHIVDWKNYFGEKLRCLKPGGVMLERMPNGKLWSFWSKQGELNDGIEVKARHCHRESASDIMQTLGVDSKIWTHDRIVNIDCIPKFLPRRLRWKASKPIYKVRSYNEDRLMKLDDDKGIYTMILVKR